jgi:4-amino-4-deoxy-L-arabinose transferase-like glycosyltransferase
MTVGIGVSGSRRSRVSAFVSANALELSALAFAVAIRIVMLFTFDPRTGYDFGAHWDHIEWFRQHLSIPAPTVARTAYHAPLYHFIGGMGRRLGLAERGLQALSVAMATARLVLLAIGLRLALPSSPRARAAALLLAAVVPCSVHLDAMLTQETLSGLLATAACVLCLLVFRASVERRWRWAVLLGIVIGLELLTKVSALVLIAVVAAAGPLEALLAPPLNRGEWRRRLGPWAVALLVALAVGGWWYARIDVLYGKPFVSSWDFEKTADTIATHAEDKPLLDRRALGYVFGWSPKIFTQPYYPSGSEAEPRFWPVLIATSFVDYYGYGFAGGYAAHGYGRRASRDSYDLVARLSVVGGTFIAALVAVAWLFLAVHLVRKRDVGRFVVLLFPMVGVLGQLSFAIQFPYDFEGVVKGSYLHFAVAPLYGVFGVALMWLGEKRSRQIVAGIALTSVAMVATYTLFCRWG